MLKYRGTYRVQYECDVRTGQSGEFTYIPCHIRPGANVYRHNDNTLLVYISGIKTVNRLLREYPGIFRPYQTGDSEASLLFKVSDIQKAAVILKAKVQGKNLSPKPKKKYNLTDEQRKEIGVRLKAARTSK